MRLLGAESSSIPGVRLRVLVEGMTAQTPCKRLFLRAILRHVSPASGPGKRIAQEAVRPIRHLSCSLLSVSLPVARSPALAGEANPPAATENKLRWSLVAMIPRLELTALECRRVAETLQSWLEDSSLHRQDLRLAGAGRSNPPGPLAAAHGAGPAPHPQPQRNPRHARPRPHVAASAGNQLKIAPYTTDRVRGPPENPMVELLPSIASRAPLRVTLNCL